MQTCVYPAQTELCDIGNKKPRLVKILLIHSTPNKSLPAEHQRCLKILKPVQTIHCRMSMSLLPTYCITKF